MPDGAKKKLEAFAAMESFARCEGKPFPRAVVNEMLALVEVGAKYGLHDTDAFPGPEGELLITFYRTDWALDVTRETTGRFTVTAEELRQGWRERFFADGLFADAAADLIRRFADAPERLAGEEGDGKLHGWDAVCAEARARR